jgi:hypothetical protein
MQGHITLSEPTEQAPQEAVTELTDEIINMDIDALKLSFSALMGYVVTIYGDDQPEGAA